MPDLAYLIAAFGTGLLVGGAGVYGVLKTVFTARGKMLDQTAAGLRESLETERAELLAARSQVADERERRARAETRLEETLAAREAERLLLEQARKQLSDTFGALSSDALKSNNQAFLDLARKTFENILTESKGDLSKRQQAIEAVVKSRALIQDPTFRGRRPRALGRRATRFGYRRE